MISDPLRSQITSGASDLSLVFRECVLSSTAFLALPWVLEVAPAGRFISAATPRHSVICSVHVDSPSARAESHPEPVFYFTATRLL